MLFNIHVKNCQTCHLLSKDFFLNCAFSVGKNVLHITHLTLLITVVLL